MWIKYWWNPAFNDVFSCWSSCWQLCIRWMMPVLINLDVWVWKIKEKYFHKEFVLIYTYLMMFLPKFPPWSCCCCSCALWSIVSYTFYFIFHFEMIIFEFVLNFFDFFPAAASFVTTGQAISRCASYGCRKFHATFQIKIILTSHARKYIHYVYESFEFWQRI